MSLLEDVKRITEKATGWKRPDDPQALLRERKPQIYRFKDDGLIPNHSKWPLVIYKSAVRLPVSLDPAAVFEDLFEANGWGDSWRDGIYNYAHYHSGIHEVLGIARGPAGFSLAAPKGARLSSKRVTLRSCRRAPDTNALKQAVIFWWSGRIHPRVRSISARRQRTAKRRWSRSRKSRIRARTLSTARRGRLCGPGASPFIDKAQRSGARRFARVRIDQDERAATVADIPAW